MGTLAAGVSVNIPLTAGQRIQFTGGSGVAVATGGQQAASAAYQLGGPAVSIGPFTLDQDISISPTSTTAFQLMRTDTRAVRTDQISASYVNPTLVTDGNSLTALSGGPKTSQLAPITDLGWVGPGLAYLEQKLQWIANVATSGQNIAQRLRAFASTVVPLNPTYVSFLEGRNSLVPEANGGGGNTLDQACALVSAYVENALSYGIRVILFTHPTATVKPAAEPGTLLQWNLKLMAYNRFVRFLASSTKGVTLVDAEAVTIDPLSATCNPKANFIRSGNDPHLTSRANFAVGRAFAAAMATQAVTWGGLYRAESNYDNKVATTGSSSVRALNSNPMFQGTGGTPIGSISGVIAATYTAGVAAGTATTVGSVVARADGFGNDQQIVASSMSASCNVFIRPDNAEAAAYVTPGDYVYGICNINVTGMAGITGVELQLVCQGGSLINNYGLLASAAAAADYDQSDITNFWIATPITQLNVGAPITLVYPRLNVYSAAGSGAATIKCGRMALVNLGPAGLLTN